MVATLVQRRARNAADTREAILAAARCAFTQQGFDQVGVREITKAAGVNVSLVSRYFGSKERLFAEAMRTGASLGWHETRSLGDVLAAFQDRDGMVDVDVFNPILALIHSAPVLKAQPVLRDYLEREALVPLAGLIGGVDADKKASLVVALLIGAVIMRAVIKSDPLASATRLELETFVEQIIGAVASSSASADVAAPA